MTGPRRSTAAGPEAAAASRSLGARLPLVALPGLILLAMATALVGLIATGATSASALVPADPLVTWGTPVVRVLHHLGLLLAVGAGGTVVLLLPGPSRRAVTSLDPVRRLTTRLAGAGAALWAAASLALVPLGGLEAAGAGSGLNPWTIGMAGDLGRLQLSVVVTAALSALFFTLARSTVLSAWGLAFAGIGIGLLGLAGHAGASLDHTNAVNAMALHLVAVAVWAGGLLAIGLIAPRLEDGRLALTLQRFSRWALAAVIALAVGGVLSAQIRLGSFAALVVTEYGHLVLLKTVLLLVLAGLGALQRQRLGDRLRFRHLALTEGVIMAVVIGASVALGRTAPPVPQEIPAVGDLRTLSLVGFLPPSEHFRAASLFTDVEMDWVALVIAIAMAGLYLAGVVRLHRRGDRWSLVRTVPWILGCLAFAWVMCGGVAAWGRFRFDAHMVQHMSMMMVVPPLWVLGAPVTLMSRAITPRTDGSRGLREWVLAALHSGYARFVSSPPLAGVFFAGSLVAFYFTPLFELAMYHHLGHVLMTVHFLLSGYLFAWVIIGIDPATYRISPVLKLITLLVTLTFHAFFGVALVSATWLMAEGWYTALGMYSAEELALIQRTGGSFMWAVSEVPTVLYAVLAAFQWSRSEERRARQFDRKADRDGDAELAAYNAYLAGLEGRGEEERREATSSGHEDAATTASAGAD